MGLIDKQGNTVIASRFGYFSLESGGIEGQFYKGNERCDIIWSEQDNALYYKKGDELIDIKDIGQYLPVLE